MRQALNRLDYLCIEIMSKNINRFCRTSKENWKLRFCNDIGDRLILASMANSTEGILEETVYQFILQNFIINNFKIFGRLLKKIEYYNFLNGLSIDELTINLDNEIKLKEENNEKFRLIANKLNLNCVCHELFLKSYKFLSNLSIRKRLNINFNFEDCKQKIQLEKLLLNILENTSLEIENIEIPFSEPTKEFLEKLIEIFNERKYLKTFYVNFDEKLPKLLKIFFLDVSTSSIIHQSIINSPLASYLSKNNDFNESLKSFKSIENLHLKCSNCKNSNEIKEIFSFLESLNLKNMKKIKLYSFNMSHFGKEFRNFIKNFRNLEELKLISIFMDNYNIFDLILPCLNTLKVLRFNFIRISDWRKMENFKLFLSHSSIHKIIFCRSFFGNEYSLEVIRSLENLQNTLTSLTFNNCTLSNEFLNFLPKILQNFNKLIVFHFRHSKIDNETLMEIFKSLQSSCQTLQNIVIKGSKIPRRLENCIDLFNLLEKCNGLISIRIKIIIKEDKIPELLSILKKYQKFLEEIDLDFCWSEKYHGELCNFLSGCTQLRYVKRYILKDIVLKDEDLINSLTNSKYSLKYTNKLNDSNLSIFPHIFSI